MPTLAEYAVSAERTHDVAELNHLDFVNVCHHGLDRVQAFSPALRVQFENMLAADQRLKDYELTYIAAKEQFATGSLDLHKFNAVADEYYYDYYYAPEIFASGVVQSSVDVITWVARHLLRFKTGSITFGIEIDFNGCPGPGVGFGNLIRALRHHSAHFEDWVDLSAPSKEASPSWAVLERFGYMLPLANTSVLYDALHRASQGKFETYIARLRGAVIDLCVEAQRAGSRCITLHELRKRSGD